MWYCKKKTGNDANIFNKFTSEIVKVTIKQRELVLKSDISGFINKSDLNKR